VARCHSFYLFLHVSSRHTIFIYTTRRVRYHPCGFWIQIRIPDADPDPGEPNQCADRIYPVPDPHSDLELCNPRPPGMGNKAYLSVVFASILFSCILSVVLLCLHPLLLHTRYFLLFYSAFILFSCILSVVLLCLHPLLLHTFCCSTLPPSSSLAYFLFFYSTSILFSCILSVVLLYCHPLLCIPCPRLFSFVMFLSQAA
jgi:hypothetical protein